MDSIDKFLKLYSYKFNKGYPDINDEQDILLLESILKEEFNIIIAAVTSATEDLHEVFIAMFLAGHNRISDINKNNGAFIFVSIVSSHTFSETSLILVG